MALNLLSPAIAFECDGFESSSPRRKKNNNIFWDKKEHHQS